MNVSVQRRTSSGNGSIMTCSDIELIIILKRVNIFKKNTLSNRGHSEVLREGALAVGLM